MKNIIFIVKTPLRWFKKLYNWTKHWAATKNAPYALFGVSFIESSFFPVPPDVLLIAMTIGNRKKWLRYASICTIGSVCGALLGYLIGYIFFETLGKFIVHIYHLEKTIDIIKLKYQQNAFFVIFTAAFTPIPYKAITITAGLFRISLSTLVIASIIGRAGRFFLVAGALRMFGKKIEDSIEKYFDIFSVAFILLAIVGILFLKYVFK